MSNEYDLLWPQVSRSAYTGELDPPVPPLPAGYDRYASAGLIGQLLREAGLSHKGQTPVPYGQDWCSVDSVWPHEWPAGATMCVNVRYYLPRQSGGYRGPEEVDVPAWHNGARRVAQHLENLGFQTCLVEKTGSATGRVHRWIVVHRVDGTDDLGHWRPISGDPPWQQTLDAHALVGTFTDDEGEELREPEAREPVCNRHVWSTDAEILLRRLPVGRQQLIEAAVEKLKVDPWEDTVQQKADRSVRTARPGPLTQLTIVVAGGLLVVAELILGDNPTVAES